MATELTGDRLRSLAETRSPEGKVLSVFINLDPHEVPTPSARDTEVRAVLDAASRRVRDHDSLTPAERTALEGDIARIREHLAGAGAEEMTGGARGLAIFASEPASLFEVLPLPHAVAPEVRIADRPAIAAIARIAATAPWWIVLADRRHARLLSGTLDGLTEHWRTEDEVAGHHDQSPSHSRDQGGTSFEHHKRSAEKDVLDHLRGVSAELRRLLEDEESAGLLIGGPAETANALRSLLPTDLERAVAGQFDVEVWDSSPEQVLKAARTLLTDVAESREQELVQRVSDSVGTGRGATGLGPVLEALSERRVETLLVQTGTRGYGVRCPGCGTLSISTSPTCAGCGTATEAVDDIVEEAVAQALTQGAATYVLPDGHELLARASGIAAATRF